MSTDYEAVCDVCKVGVHAGQVSAGVAAFGYSSKDEKGRAAVATFIVHHAECNPAEGVRIVIGDQAGSPRHETYASIEHEDVEAHVQALADKRLADEIARVRKGARRMTACEHCDRDVRESDYDDGADLVPHGRATDTGVEKLRADLARELKDPNQDFGDVGYLLEALHEHDMLGELLEARRDLAVLGPPVGPSKCAHCGGPWGDLPALPCGVEQNLVQHAGCLDACGASKIAQRSTR